MDLATHPAPPAAPSRPSAARRDRILALLRQLVPLVEGLVGTLRVGAIFGLLAVAWLRLWMLLFADWPAAVAVPLLVVAGLPLPVLIGFWSGLAKVVELPQTVARLWSDTGTESARLGAASASLASPLLKPRRRPAPPLFRLAGGSAADPCGRRS